MHNEQSLVEISLKDKIQDLVERFGAWRIALAVLSAAWRQQQRRNLASGLSDRMREDIGLPVDGNRRLPSRLSLWDLRI
jgi:hypothetical protein